MTVARAGASQPQPPSTHGLALLTRSGDAVARKALDYSDSTCIKSRCECLRPCTARPRLALAGSAPHPTGAAPGKHLPGPGHHVATGPRLRQQGHAQTPLLREHSTPPWSSAFPSLSNAQQGFRSREITACRVHAVPLRAQRAMYRLPTIGPNEKSLALMSSASAGWSGTFSAITARVSPSVDNAMGPMNEPAMSRAVLKPTGNFACWPPVPLPCCICKAACDVCLGHRESATPVRIARAHAAADVQTVRTVKTPSPLTDPQTASPYGFMSNPVCEASL